MAKGIFGYAAGESMARVNSGINEGQPQEASD